MSKRCADEMSALHAQQAVAKRRRVLEKLSVAEETPTRTYEPSPGELQSTLEQLRAPLTTQEL
jgi:hypothetical protein